MKVLVVGNGAREHALVWKFSQSKRISGLYCVPGNAGTEDLGQNLDTIDMCDIQGIAAAARNLRIDLVFVGPEAPLAAGLVDALQAAGIAVIGPDRNAAQLESSKAFSKAFLERHAIPTAQARVFKNANAFADFIKQSSGPWVVKKSGLAAGKGVLESDNHQELINFGLDCLKDDSILVEEYLRGFEVSIFTISDGNSWKILPSAADYKKAGDGNSGPNTGGMGAICPVPWLDKSMMKRIEQEIVDPVMQGLKNDGLLYKGILYYGLMITAAGPKVLEFNVRFGDPEAQVIIPLVETDFCNLWEAVAQGKLESIDLAISTRSAIGVVMAAPGYPGDYPRNIPVQTGFTNHDPNRLLFHAGTIRENGELRTNGGRCFTMVGIAAELTHARSEAYSLSQELSFAGGWSRSDIGANIYSQKY